MRTVLVEDYGVPTAAGQWYDVTVRALGSRVEVWRAPEGETPQLVLAHDGVGQATSSTLILGTYRDATYAFDDLRLDTLARMRAHYAYDALGRRIAKTVDAGTGPLETRYRWDGWRLAQEYAPDGILRASYAHGNGLDELLSMRRDGQDYFYLQDDQGNVLALTDASGAVVERYAYGPGGEPLVFDAANQPLPQSAHGNPFCFTGAQWDPETGLYYLRHRYYDPQAGRFITRDPLGAWADPTALGNPYAYCGNSPWDTIDPLGLRPASGHPIDVMLDEMAGNESRFHIPGGYGPWYDDYIAEPVSRMPNEALQGTLAAFHGYTGIPLPYADGTFSDYMYQAGETGSYIAAGAAAAWGAAKACPIVAKKAKKKVLSLAELMMSGSDEAFDIIDPGRRYRFPAMASTFDDVTRYRPFNADNYRHNLTVFTGWNPGPFGHAHHIFPQKFRRDFMLIYGINIHSPRYLTWWNPISHLANVAAYNRAWEVFFKKPRAYAEVMNEGRRLADLYGLTIYF